MQSVEHVNGKVLWTNMHLLFWLSLVPFASGWMGENHFSQWTVTIYGVILMMAGIAYYLLGRALIQLHGKNSTIGKAFGKDRKGIMSVVYYILGIALSFLNPLIGVSFYALVAAIWFIPDKRIESKLIKEEKKIK